MLYARVEGRDKREYLVWKNPQNLRSLGSAGMRAIVTEHDLYFWQSHETTHGDVAHQIEIDGVHLLLRIDHIEINQEVIVVPEAFPWLYEDFPFADPDIDERRKTVERWLATNSRLTAIYPTGCAMIWYL